MQAGPLMHEQRSERVGGFTGEETMRGRRTI